MNATARVRFTRVGFHRWPEAPTPRRYLATSHRHVFHIEASLPVQHDQREVEFHDLLDRAQQTFPDGDMGTLSCESLARNLAGALSDIYSRPVTVTVLEDGECGATVTSEAP